MNVGFLGFDQFHGRENIGSSRIRCDYLIKYWGEGHAERYMYGKKYDAVILQKAYFAEFAEAYEGIKILDLCDPDWLNWTYRFQETMVNCDAVTTSTVELAKAVVQFTDKPVVFIRDRIDMDTVKGKRKEHVGETKKVAWFGYSDNFEMLDQALKAILDRGLELLVIANKPYQPPAFGKKIMEEGRLTNYPWTPETWLDDILKADVVINPKSSNARFRYKSDNKTTQSWAMGIPVAHDERELDAFASESARRAEQKRVLKIVEDDLDVRKSVLELKDLFKDVEGTRSTKTNTGLAGLPVNLSFPK